MVVTRSQQISLKDCPTDDVMCDVGRIIDTLAGVGVMGGVFPLHRELQGLKFAQESRFYIKSFLTLS